VLSRDELSKHMLPEATRMSLELEARTGERKLTDGSAKSMQDLQALLVKAGADRDTEDVQTSRPQRYPWKCHRDQCRFG